MELIKEYTFKVIIIIICLVISLELAVSLYLNYTSNKIFENTLSSTLEKAKVKTTEIAEYINKYINNLFINYITKFKLISKNTYLFNGKKDSSENEVINRNSKIILNNDLDSRILEAKYDEIIKIDCFNKLLNKDTKIFDYFDYYIKKFGDETDNNKILNTIRKEHDELNYISYHNITGETNIKILDEETKIKLNFMIPMLKSIILQRFLVKKSLMEMSRIFILTEKEFIIYPPEDSNKLYLKLFFPKFNTGFQLDQSKDIYFLIYDYINQNLEDKTYHLAVEMIEYQNLYTLGCFKFPFIKEKPKDSIICLEINFGKVVKTINLDKTKKFNFGIFVPMKTEKLNDLNVLGNSYGDAYKEFPNVFNTNETTPLEYIIDTTKSLKYYSLYHFLYLETTKLKKEHPDIDVKISELNQEYKTIVNNIFKSILTKNQKIVFNQTSCRRKLISNKYECFKDEVEMNVFQVALNLNEINEDIVDTNITKITEPNVFLYSIIYTNPKTNKKDIKVILILKLVRFILLNFFLTAIILSILNVIIYMFSSHSIENINNFNNSLKEITLDVEKRKIKLLNENKYFKTNKEMWSLNDVYDLIKRSLIIKEAFNTEYYLQQHLTEFFYLVREIKDKNIKDICYSLLGINHFNNKVYLLSEKEFRSVTRFIKENEKKIKFGEDPEKIKDEIKRSSTVSYLNEYTNFDNIDENMLDIIYMNIYKQKFYYLYAMVKFKLGCEININQKKNNKIKREKYLKDAIKYFTECKTINESIGINQIKIIYSLIMITKCYIHLNDYKNSITNINQALSLYFNFSRTFHDYHSRYYDPKIMLFVESNIFHYILYIFSLICSKFNKPFASSFIIFQIFETSPFLLKNVHYHAGLTLTNFLEKNKAKIFKFDKKIYKNKNIIKEFEKSKKYLAKIVSRLNIKSVNEKNIKTNKTIGSKYLNSNNQTIKESNIKKSRVSSKKTKNDFTTSRYSSMNHQRKLYKNITICLSEKILKTINEQEFKDVIIKYFQKYFVQSENDKFSFIQFAMNGKKTLFFQSCTLNEFIIKLHKSKYTSETINDSLGHKNKKNLFMGLYDIFESIIKNYQIDGLNDNIIILFMASEDIRFSTIIDCMNIVEELNKNNISVYFVCFDEIISEEKINNLQSFLNGLIEGYFIQVKYYNQIKELFVNISNTKYQSNFFRFDYDCFDHNL